MVVRTTLSETDANWMAAEKALREASGTVWRAAVEMTRENNPLANLNDPEQLRQFMLSLTALMLTRAKL